MPSSTVKELLTVTRLDGEGPLFEVFAAACKEAADRSGGAYKPSTVKDMVNQADALDGNLPAALQKALLSAVAARCESAAYDSARWSAEVERTVSLLRERRAEKRFVKPKAEESEFYRASAESRLSFAITPLRADERRLLENLDLTTTFVNRIVPEGDFASEPRTRRVMAFPSESEALSFWNAAYKGVRALPTGSDSPGGAPDLEGEEPFAPVDRADAKLYELCSKGFLRLFIVHPFYCLSPLVLLNIDGPGPLLGFQLAYQEGNVVNHQVSELLAERWLQFYLAVVGKVGSLEPEPVPYPWSTARTKVDLGKDY